MGMHPRLAAVLVATACSACASVPSGSSAVVTSMSGDASVLGEGTSWVSPLSNVDLYDVREQGRTERFIALTGDGVPVVTSSSLVTFRVAEGELVALNREVGPDYENGVIRPIVQATVRRVLAAYRWDQLDSRGIRQAQERITGVAAAKIRPYHLLLESVELKDIHPDLASFTSAVSNTSVWEQHALESSARIELSREEARRLRAEAEGVAAAHAIVAPTLSPDVLEESAVRAWSTLSQSPGTHLQVLNDPKSDTVEVLP